jgi:FMN-dependent NADH-azoreductase
MTKLLYIQASPRGAESRSIEVAEAYLASVRSGNPGLEVDTIDLWREDLPAFDGDKAAAKMSVLAGAEPGGAQKTAWDELVTIANRFIAADRYLLAVPMWNSGIPYRLKQYIDIIHQPGLLWGFDPEKGYYGLLKGKQATLVFTSGVYGTEAIPEPASGTDHQSTYMRDWLDQAGVTDIAELRFQPTLLTSDPEAELAVAKVRARALAVTHGAFETA